VRQTKEGKAKKKRLKNFTRNSKNKEVLHS
jgi:hypothetical protein